MANQLYHLTAKVVKWAVEAGCIFVVENHNLASFGQLHSGLKSHIWQCILFFIHVSTVAHGKRKQCLLSTPLNFWLSLHNALDKTANINTPVGD